MLGVRRLSEVLAARASANFVGREDELRLLMQCSDGSGPLLTWIHGIAGVGKSALLQEFSSRAASIAVRTIQLDCRFIEPTVSGFLAQMQAVAGCPIASLEEAASALSSGTPTVLVLDGYESLRLLDCWIRQEFLPALSDPLRIILCGRFGPGPGWTTSLAWRGLMRTIQLHPFSERESLELLDHSGVDLDTARLLHRLTKGHPLALMLAGQAGNSFGTYAARDDGGGLFQQLVQLYLAEVTDRELRRAVEAISVVRRTTQSLLAALLPDMDSRSLYQRLEDLSITEPTSDGLMIQEQVQHAISAWLRSSDPQRYRSYRRAALRQLQSESIGVNRSELWRYTADLLYLVQNPNVREAFFPTGAQSLSVEQARPEDWESILSIAQTHETPSAVAALEQWWELMRDSFHVLRDGSGAIRGFYLKTDWHQVRGTRPVADPMMESWLRHLRTRPIGKDETAIFIRRWLDESVGELPSPVQAASWLDVKRPYIELRPFLRRCYVAACNLPVYEPIVGPLGFRVVQGGSVAFDGRACHLAFLDFGPNSIEGWLSHLAGEPGFEQDDIVDSTARELTIEGTRVTLTALEFGVFTFLRRREGKPASRAELLAHVWEQRSDTSSNVVDVVVRSLRRKLGHHGTMIATVRGVGYRFQKG